MLVFARNLRVFSSVAHVRAPQTSHILALLHMNKLPHRLLAAVASLASFTAVAQTPPPQFPRLSKTIDSLIAIDQRLVQQLRGGLRAHNDTKRLTAEHQVLTARHQPLLEAIAKRYGYPGTWQVGA